MTICLIQTEAKNLTWPQFYALKNMTLYHSDSFMKRLLLDAKDFGINFPIVIAKNKNRYLGWALMAIYNNKKVVMTYVKPEHRRKGIGSKLVSKFKEKENFLGFHYEEVSRRFYKKLNVGKCKI